MGGKTNQAQRTKNSVRPSSSGRSAEFLQGTSYTFSGFLGTVNTTEETPRQTTFDTPINEEISNIDPNVQVVLKKLTKKDAVTKGKALLELAKLIEESEMDVVRAVLPLWPRLFKNLYADVSHRVREYCQQAHKAFVMKLGKLIAPCLKQLLPEWLGSQFDTYAPAASVAKASLSIAFPSHKLKDVLAFCNDEIVDYLHRMLLVPMPMPTDKSYTPEEYEARSERLVCMGLFTYHFYLDHSVADLWKDKAEQHQTIVSDGKFWTYSKHKSPQVKSAWLEAIGAILDRSPELMNEFHPKIVAAVVYNLDEPDALVQAAAWTCLLRIQRMIPSWIEYTNLEKALLVKLRKVLSEPNQGLTMHLLPFVSHMNQSVLGAQCSRFFVEFFQSLNAAMKKTKPGNAHELKSLIDTYFECLHFILKKVHTESEFLVVDEKDSWMREFVCKFMVDPMLWTVWENGRALECIARNVGRILGYWKMNEELYSDLWQCFWLSIGENVFKLDDNVTTLIMSNQIELVIRLRATTISDMIVGSPKKRVTFGQDTECEGVDSNANSPSIESPTIRINNWEELYLVADLLSQRCVTKMLEEPNPIFIRLLYKLLTHFTDARLANSIDKVVPMSDFVDKVLDWTSDENLVSEEMVDLLLGYGTKAIPLENIVDKLLRVENISVKNWTVLRISQDPNFNLAESKSISVYTEHILLRLVNGLSMTDDLKMLKLYFDKTLIVGPSVEHKNMIELICSEIDGGQHNNIHLNTLARYLMKRLTKRPEFKELAKKLFRTIFQLQLNCGGSENIAVLQETIKDKGIELSGHLNTECMERVRRKTMALFEEDDFNLDTVLQSCRLILDGNGNENIEFIRSYLTAEDSIKYLKLILNTVFYVQEANGRLPSTMPPPMQIANHFRALMSLITTATIEAELISQTKSAPRDDLTLVDIYDCFAVLKEIGMEDPRLVDAFSDLSKVMEMPDTAETNHSLEYERFIHLMGVPEATSDPLDVGRLCKDLWENCQNLIGHFEGAASFNTMADKAILRQSVELISRIMPLTKSKQLNLMYNCKPEQLDNKCLWMAANLAHILRILVQNCPTEFTSEQWDFLRIAMSSWILTISQSFEEKDTRPVLIQFVVSVLKLFETLMTFFESERQKSSTQLFCKVIEEWNSVFAREVNTVLLLILNKLLDAAIDSEMNKYLLGAVLPCFEKMNFIYLVVSKDISKSLTQQEFLHKLFAQLSHRVPTIRDAICRIVDCVIPQLVSRDNDLLTKSDSIEGISQDGHYLATIIQPLLLSDDFNVEALVKDFHYKYTETDPLPVIPASTATSYLYLWHGIFAFCRRASPELRAFYANWLASHGFEGVLLKLIFRVLPQDVVQNFETKLSMVDAYFNAVKGLDICDKSLNPEKLACYAYLNLVRLLPAVVRKCWTNYSHRTNLLIEKFNMFYASTLLCQEELRALMEKREKMDNIQIGVHNSTREIIAVYAKEEARMELKITLPLNYPLAVAKVEGGKSVNSRIQSKEVLMQLNLFLSHQNGTIFNGLSLWKRNLDKKFEGVEECYVCYSVIHQDTYQLPKLTCKTCKKRFHSPCLYRWFNTSNKSTCPICRNIF